MQLTKGSLLGSYRILEHIASGGMGEVYKARHTQLERWVAIKVISDRLADDAGTLERFRREAKSASRLEHPNICRVYNFGQDGQRSYLVLEYLKGETLAATMAKKKLSLAEVLEVGAQIAEALDHAHTHGLVHRDLKPSNVMLTKSGVKVLDFGVAKRSEPADLGTGSFGGDELDESITLTREGVTIGTLPYMSPEQVGQGDSDARTDIHALGAILYELLAEHPPYEGRTPAALAVEILRGTPQPIAEVEPSTPASLIRVVDRCLEKNPSDRWQTAGDLASELRRITDSGGEMLLPAGATKTKGKSKRSWFRVTVSLTVAASAAAALSLLIRNERENASGPPPGMQLFDAFAPLGHVFSQNHQDAAVSPDGNTFLFVAVDSSGERLLFTKPLSGTDFELIGASAGAHTPFWSPDASRIGYFDMNDLRTLDLAGDDPSEKLADVSLESRGGSWGRGDVLLFSPGLRTGIFRVSPGRVAERVTTPDQARGEIGHLWPYFLPDGEQFLYLVVSPIDTIQGIYIASLNEPAGQRVLSSMTSAVYASGHILFLTDGSLFAQSFNPRTRTLSGSPVHLVDNVASISTLSAFSASETGVLTYSREGIKDVTELVWRDRDGEIIETVGEPQRYRNPSLSRDGRYLAVEVFTDDRRGILTQDLLTGRSERTNDSIPGARNPVWAPDSRSVAFVSDGIGGWEIYRWVINSSEVPRLLLRSPTELIVTDWSPDAATLFYAERRDRGDYDVMALNLESGEVTRILDAPDNEHSPRISPSGLHIAYVSNEQNGRHDVYVQPFPTTGLKCLISTEGGWDPQWGRGDDLLYYLEPSGNLMVAEVVMDDACAPSPPHVLFRPLIGQPSTSRNHYVYSPESERFLVNSRTTDPRSQAIGVMVNWPATVGSGRQSTP